jgi:signal transduction histidine kinase
MSRTANREKVQSPRRGKKPALRAAPKPSKAPPAPKLPAIEYLTSAPDWACNLLFHRVRAAIWEGEIAPLNARRIFPEDSPVISTLPLDEGVEWGALVHPVDRARVEREFAALASSRKPFSVEYRIIDRNGAVIWVRHSVESVEKTKAGPYLRGFVTDIQAEKEYQLESLRVSEREQNRIGQDLHDDLCQVLAGVSCLMRVFEGRIVARAPEEIESLRELNQQIVDAMHRTRALTHGLFPGRIQIADIRGALLELASQVRTRFKVIVNTQFAGRFPKHSSAQIIQIYRISQEAISNSIKHGRATQLDVKLEALEDTMQLTITDDGTGLPKGESATPGVGLHIMKYRANMLGGEVSVMDNSNRGVMVRLRYPFQSN